MRREASVGLGVCLSLCLGAAAAAPPATKDAQDQALQGVLATAKMAGACGIMDAIINFQRTTGMEGGDDFVIRFWELEAARLGKSVRELSEICDASVRSYEALWGAAERSGG